MAFGWSPAWQALGEADRARVIDAVEARLVDTVSIPATALIGIARKP